MGATDKTGSYSEIFSDDKSKAEAFDKIADRFYKRNFGMMSKADMETLMFSIFIEQILAGGDEDFSSYSDYALAKELGITQSKVSNLKVRKQLQYPHNYDWKSAFERISKRVRYENGKIILPIPDINLYYEIKHAVEEMGGVVEVTLNRSLLVVPLSDFLDFLESITDDKDRDVLRKAVRKEYRERYKDQEIVEQEPIGKVLKKCGENVIVDIIEGVVSDPCNAGLKCVMAVGKNVLQAIRSRG